jgi:enterochelin esterase-like enzyme
MSRIRFEIVPPVRHPTEEIFISGNVPALGDWDLGRALKLSWEPPFHRGEIEAETGFHLEYKIHRGSWEVEAVTAQGDIPANQVHEVWLDATRHHTVADWKDRFMGRLMRDRVYSRVLAGERELLLWLPPAYAMESTLRFPLIVFHDGPNVFDPATSFSGVDWAADECNVLLASEAVMPQAIIAAVIHPEGFTEDNVTHRDFDLSPELGGAAYSQFVASELLPHLESRYRTIPQPASRFLIGASLGALNTFYTALHHPGVFGRYGCLSTAFEDISQRLPEDSLALQALANEPALPTDVRVYFDHGRLGLDACYGPYHDRLRELLTQKGWQEGNEFLLRSIQGSGHDELSWRMRLGEALRFLAA